MQNQIEQPQAVCGARTRGGHCANRPEPGKKRCRMHGGAKGSGARPGNKNALKHGYYSKEAITRRREAKRLLIESLDVLDLLVQQKNPLP
jgi:hypothetical protein